MESFKIFFKHLFTSIRRRPMQPVLLIVVIALAVMVCASAVDMKRFMEENDEKSKLASRGNADIIVTVNSFSESRFLLVGDIEKVLPEGTKSFGIYSLPVLFGENNDFCYGVAGDFSKADDIFDLNLISSKSITDASVKNTVIVSRSFSQKNSVKVGDTINFSVLGAPFSMQVCGITQYPVFGTYDLFFDTEAVVRLLSQKSLTVSLLGEEFEPVGAVYIKAEEGEKEEFVSSLVSAYPDMTVTDVLASDDNANTGLTEIILLMVIFSVFFVFMVIYCCFHILSKQRTEETALFYGVGAKRYLMNSLSVAEMFIYWLVGGGLGIILSLPLSAIMIRLGKFDYCSVGLNGNSVLIALSVNLLASELSLSFFILSDYLKKKHHKKANTKEKDKPVFTIVLFALTVIGSVLTFSLPVDKSMIVGVATLLCMLIFVFVLSKNCVRFLADFFAKRAGNKIVVRYGLKNAKKVDTLGNTAGLVGLSMTVLLIIATLLSMAKTNVTVNEIFLQGDYLVLNASEGAKDLLKETDGVKDVYSVYKEYVEVFDIKLMLFATDNRDACSKGYAIDELPQGKEMYCGRAIADYYGIEIGDEVEITIGNKTIKTVFTKAVESNDGILVVDAEEWGLPMNYLLVEGKEGVSDDTLYKNIMTTLAFESATVIEKEAFTSEWISSIGSYILCAELVVIFVFVFSGIGMADSIVSSYRSRREEFYFYQSAGMSGEDVRKMKASELGFTFGIGLAVFLIFSVLVFFLLCQTALGVKMDVINVFKEAIAGK